MTNAVIGTLTIEIIKLLSLPHTADVPIFIGQGNIAHMQNKHPDDYAKYGHDIALILECPDYVGINIKDSSIEYVKEYIIDEEYVKVAVRVSSNNVLFVRSIYLLNAKRAQNFIKTGTLKRLSKKP